MATAFSFQTGHGVRACSLEAPATTSRSQRGCQSHVRMAAAVDMHKGSFLSRNVTWNERRTSHIVSASVGTATASEAAPFSEEAPEDVFPPPNQASLPNRIRALAFYLTTFAMSIPLFVVMLAIHPFVMLFDRVRRLAQHFTNTIWATCSTKPFYGVEIIGAENLPPADQPCVYVANHQSFLDIYTLFHLHRPFKFISKVSNFLIPCIGWSMYLTGHVPLQRLDRRSQMECLKICVSMLNDGVSVLFFPEGTRTKDGKLGEFKKGAFSVAVKAGKPVVPLTLINTGTLMPNGLESTLSSTSTLRELPPRGGSEGGRKAVRIIVHPAITCSDADKLCEESRAVIADELKVHGFGAH